MFETQLQIDVIRIINLYVSIFNFNCFCMFVMFVYSSCPFLSFEVPFFLSSTCMRMYDKQKSPVLRSWMLRHWASHVTFRIESQRPCGCCVSYFAQYPELGLGLCVIHTRTGFVRVPLLPPSNGSKIFSCIGAKILSSKSDRRGFRYCKTCCTPRSRPSIFAVARPAGAMCLE